MENTFIILFYLVIFFFIGKWLYKIYVSEPEKGKKIGLYKFQEFSHYILRQFNVDRNPIRGNENCLLYREIITNGVEPIGHVDYSINDYISEENMQKKSNFYFEIEVRIKDFKMKAKSNGYFKTVNYEICDKEVTNLRDKIMYNSEYQKHLQFNQLRQQ